MKLIILSCLLTLLPCLSYCMDNNAFGVPSHLSHLKPTISQINDMDFTEYRTYLYDRVEETFLDECNIVVFDQVNNIFRYISSQTKTTNTTIAKYKPKEEIRVFENTDPSSVDTKKEYFLFCPRCNKRLLSTYARSSLKCRMIKHLKKGCKNKINENEITIYQNLIQTQLDEKYPIIKKNN